MLSLNEIRNVHFRKSNFNGYKSEDVEAFIDEVQESYDQLLKENAELQKKVDVLAGKLEEYQHEEDAIRSALMNAQKLGDASLRDAKHKSEIILKDATIKAEKIVANAQTEIKREKEIVDRMQKDVADFKTNLLRLYKEHLTLINNIRSEDVLRPQTREYSNAVHIIETPFADDGYSMPNMTDMPVQPMNDTPYMGGGMPINQASNAPGELGIFPTALRSLFLLLFRDSRRTSDRIILKWRLKRNLRFPQASLHLISLRLIILTLRPRSARRLAVRTFQIPVQTEAFRLIFPKIPHLTLWLRLCRLPSLLSVPK